MIHCISRDVLPCYRQNFLKYNIFLKTLKVIAFKYNFLKKLCKNYSKCISSTGKITANIQSFSLLLNKIIIDMFKVTQSIFKTMLECFVVKSILLDNAFQSYWFGRNKDIMNVKVFLNKGMLWNAVYNYSNSNKNNLEKSFLLFQKMTVLAGIAASNKKRASFFRNFFLFWILLRNISKSFKKFSLVSSQKQIIHDNHHHLLKMQMLPHFGKAQIFWRLNQQKITREH